MRLFFLLISLVFSLHAIAQDTTKFHVDRPGIADLPYLVKKNYLQIESGIDYMKRDAAYRWQIPTTLVRTRISSYAELRIAVKHLAQDSLVNELHAPFKWENGIAPLNIGIKIPFVKQKGAIPDVALMTNLILPSIASKRFKANTIGHEIYLLCNNDFNDKWSLNYNAAIIWEEAIAIGMYAVCLTYQPKEKLAIFIENYDYFSNEHEIGIDGGVTYLIDENLQVDVSLGGSRLNNQLLFFVGAGVAWGIKVKR